MTKVPDTGFLMPIGVDDLIGSVEMYWNNEIITESEINMFLSFREELSWFVLNIYESKGTEPNVY